MRDSAGGGCPVDGDVISPPKKSGLSLRKMTGRCNQPTNPTPATMEVHHFLS